ncbi:MAG: enoyl-CoA hydratase/isomerase family protein [Chloroflexi bacterium]|nr:MAG: enoyl-CoA hydratase/isomerase family protein [Chloroflexota bacterium]
MKYETLKVERQDALMLVRFNRPEKKNAINRQMHLEVQAVCRALADDFETRVVILGGEGGVFSSGADTSEWRESASANELEVRHMSGIGSRTSAAIEGLDQITIASVQSFAIGGALVLAACCDLRVAGESAWFSIPEVELGLPLGWNALPRLAREMGHARALELTITCDRFSAEKAYEYGLVTHVSADEEEERMARELAERIIANPPLPVALTKATMKSLKRGSEMGDAVYSDADLLLYSRLLAQRRRRLEQQGRA